MPRTEDEDLSRVHLWLFRDDVEWIKERFGSKESMGFSKAIRTILRQYIKSVEARAAKAARPVALSEGLGEILGLEPTVGQESSINAE